MKPIKYMLFFIALLSYQMACTQTNGVKYVPNDKLNIFEGTWQWESNDSIFTIEILKTIVNSKKLDSSMPDSRDFDRLIGWHELIVNGKVIETNIKNKSNSYKYEKTDFIIFSNMPSNNEKEINFSNFKNISKNKSAEGVFIIQADDNNKAKFILYERILPPKERKGAEGFTVPNRIIMTRVK